MLNKKFRRFALLFALVIAFAAVFPLTFYKVSAKADTDALDFAIQTFYSKTRNDVKVIDSLVASGAASEPQTYKALNEKAQDAFKKGDAIKANSLYASMQRIYAVATEFKKLTNVQTKSEEQSAAVCESYPELQAHKEALANDIEALYQAIYLPAVNAENFDADNSAANTIKAINAGYENFNAKVALYSKYDELLAVNRQHPEGPANKYYGYYETEKPSPEYGKKALDDCLKQAVNAVDNATANGEGVEEVKNEYLEKLGLVPRNNFEVIYNRYMDGGISATEAGALEISVDDFWKTASDEVKKQYNSQHEYLLNYFEKNPSVNGKDYTSTLTYEVNGVKIMVISAYEKNGYSSTARTGNTPAAVFMPNAKIHIYPDNLGSASKNVSDRLAEKNEKLGVGYFVKFNVYGGKTMSSVFDTAAIDKELKKEGKGGVVYVIKFNVKAYYSEIVSKDLGLMGSILGDTVLSGVWGAKDKFADINRALDIIAGTDTELCYFYKNGELVEDAASKFINIDYDSNGGILMLETASFGNFAIAAADGGAKFLSSPLFWLLAIVALIVLIIILAIIVKHVRYTVKFYPNGGTKVKKAHARKGEYFVMPKNPTREGYVFAGWFEDAKLTRRFVATRILKRRRLKAYAKWVLELTPDRVDRYYASLRNDMASHAALAPEFSIEPGKTKVFGVIEKGEKEIRLYFAMGLDVLKGDGYQVENSPAEYAETPSMFVISTKEDYKVAQKLIARLIDSFMLCETETACLKDDETKYTLAISAPAAPVEEPAEEPAEEAVVPAEEPAEEPVEETVEEVAEEVVEEEPAPATEEQLIEYFKSIRKAVCGYCLYEPNEKAENGKMLVKLYKKEEAVYCYMALDAESYSLEAVGLGFSDTPALLKVASDADLDKALELVDVMMLEHGFEKSDEEVEDKPYEGKGFGYRIHYVEE